MGEMQEEKQEKTTGISPPPHRQPKSAGSPGAIPGPRPASRGRPQLSLQRRNRQVRPRPNTSSEKLSGFPPQSRFLAGSDDRRSHESCCTRCGSASSARRIACPSRTSGRRRPITPNGVCSLEGQDEMPRRRTFKVLQKRAQQFRVPPQGVHALIVLLAARVGQFMARPAAEVPGRRRQVQLADPAVAGAPVDDQGTDEPPAQPAEAGAGRRQADAVVGRLRLRRGGPRP
jgi:hypothetical protein